MTFLKASILGAIALVTGGIVVSLPAEATVLLSAGCRMGFCTEVQFLSKRMIRSEPSGKLYEIKTAARSWPLQDNAPNERQVPFSDRSTSYVFCSTQRPAYIFDNPDGGYYAHLLNPDGKSFFGYNQSSYSLYWVTCHNFVGPNFFAPEMEAKATQLGYPGNLPEDQIELTNPADIIQ